MIKKLKEILENIFFVKYIQTMSTSINLQSVTFLLSMTLTVCYAILTIMASMTD